MAGDLFTHDFVHVFCSLRFCGSAQALIPTLPIFSKLGSHEREIGVLIGIAAVASLTSRLFEGGIPLKCSEKGVMILGALLSAITFLAFILFRPFWPFLIIRFLQGVASACIDTAAIASVINMIPLAYRARALGHFLLAPSLAMAVAAPFGIFLINQYGFTTLFLSGAALPLAPSSCLGRLKDRQSLFHGAEFPSHSTSFLNLKIIAPAIMSFLQLFVWGTVSAFFPIYSIQCGVDESRTLLHRHGHNDRRGSPPWGEKYGHP